MNDLKKWKNIDDVPEGEEPVTIISNDGRKSFTSKQEIQRWVASSKVNPLFIGFLLFIFVLSIMKFF